MSSNQLYDSLVGMVHATFPFEAVCVVLGYSNQLSIMMQYSGMHGVENKSWRHIIILHPRMHESCRFSSSRIYFKISLLESNVNILERDCKVAQLFVDAAASRKDSLYLGLDISTRSTGYAVLRPSTATMATPGDSDQSDHDVDDHDDDPHHKRVGFLREVGEANLVEWGYISGNGSNGKKGDEVDVGMIVEETLMRVAARCGRSIKDSSGE